MADSLPPQGIYTWGGGAQGRKATVQVTTWTTEPQSGSWSTLVPASSLDNSTDLLLLVWGQWHPQSQFPTAEPEENLGRSLQAASHWYS